MNTEPRAKLDASAALDADLVADAWNAFAAIASEDTAVPDGALGLPSDDPKVRAFARGLMAPMLAETGAQVTVDDANNVVAQWGSGIAGTEVLLVGYPVTHHGSSADATTAVFRDEPGRRWFGVGASQGKGALACVIAAARAALRRGTPLEARVIVAVCSEGRSSHAASTALLNHLGGRPASAILAMGTGNRITTRNRGRVDLSVRVPGLLQHTSAATQPDENALVAAAAILRELARLQARSPDLEETIVPWRISSQPIAPHTMPQECTIALDCRFPPGRQANQVAEKVARIVEAVAPGSRLEVGESMLPACVRPDAPVVRALIDAGRRAGAELATNRPAWTFDAGVYCERGVPAVMFGPSSTAISGDEILATEWVAQEQIRVAARTFYETIVAWPRVRPLGPA
jgi:acetylornithine deacetylase/succinyl-diaminopimelate desuccinylase-like protein